MIVVYKNHQKKITLTRKKIQLNFVKNLKDP